MTKEQDKPRVRLVSPAEAVPVYNCVIYLRKIETSIEARVANLTNVTFTGDSEREVLQKAVTEFKRIVAEHREKKHPVPIVDPPPPEENETVRYVAVHL